MDDDARVLNIERALIPPPGPTPVPIGVEFHITNLNEIDSEKECFQVTGTLTLTWKDTRLAFDPEATGIRAQVFQGSYQVNEVSPAWYPQVVLANAFNGYDKQGSILRIHPDGTCEFTESLTATARVRFDLRHLPFDKQTLMLDFQILGFRFDEVQFNESQHSVVSNRDDLRVAQWKVGEIASRIDIAPNSYNRSSAFIVMIGVTREPLFMLRTIILPLMLCVLLSMSVFWMEPTDLGDRMNVSCFGILTSVAYLIVISDLLPQISYVTLTHVFLNASLLVMFATAIMNLTVYLYEKRGHSSHWIDVLCRWGFPSFYLGAIGLAFLWIGVLS
ncbi:MAG: hypothetical protein ACK5OB_04395 [Pirellula sp.]